MTNTLQNQRPTVKQMFNLQSYASGLQYSTE